MCPPDTTGELRALEATSSQRSGALPEARVPAEAWPACWALSLNSGPLARSWAWPSLAPASAAGWGWQTPSHQPLKAVRVGRMPAEKHRHQGQSDSSSCSARPAGAPGRLPSRGPSTRALREHSAPGHRPVSTQRHPLTIVSPVGFSSVESGHSGPAGVGAAAFARAPGQRGRPGHGKGPVALGSPRAGRDASRLWF